MTVVHRIAPLLLALLLACEGADPPARVGGEGRTFAALKEAARAHGVPLEVVVAAGWAETRLRHRDGDTGGRGLFQLDAPAIRRAAKLTGRSAERIGAELESNALAFAALVADNARPRPAAGATAYWLDAVAGVRTTGAAAEATAEAARRALEVGFEARLKDGWVRLKPSPYAVTRLAARPDTDQARWVRSPNYTDASRTPADVDSIIIHVTQGSYAGSISWFQNPESQVSTQYVVRSADGEVTQMVEEEDIAWHARSWNGRSIGIEHEGFIDDPAWFTDAMYRESARLVRGIGERWNIPLDRQHILGHVELSGNDHTDPGPHWNWDRYMQLVNGPDQPAPECPVLAASGGVVDDDSPCFHAFGPLQYWRDEAAGVGGHLLWTNGFVSDDPSNWAEWRLAIAADGEYDLAVHVVAPFNLSERVPYKVRAADGEYDVVLDQSAGDGWRDLGSFLFATEEDQWVRVFDNTGEDADDRHITVDAVRLTRAGMTPPDAGPDPDAGVAPPLDAAIPDAAEPTGTDARRPPPVGQGSPDVGVVAPGSDGGVPLETKSDDGGCECDTTPGAPGAALLLLLATVRRRRP